MRPVTLIGRVAEQGFKVIRHVYPYAFDEEPVHPASGSQEHVSCLEGQAVAGAQCNGASPGAAQIRRMVCYRGRLWCHRLAAPMLCVALGTERTIEFAFRIEVDFALKALSPAINDPTTAVLAIDQLHRLLRLVGKRSLANRTVNDDAGNPRVFFRTPDWGDYVHISFREIRQYGAGSLQIERRLRAMIENLMKTLHVSRHAALRRELELLDAAILREHMFAEDIALARIPDTQGLGGAAEAALPTRSGSEDQQEQAERADHAQMP